MFNVPLSTGSRRDTRVSIAHTSPHRPSSDSDVFQWINNTKVIFNDKFVDYIINVRKEHAELYNCLKFKNEKQVQFLQKDEIAFLNETQRELREIFKNDKKKGCFNTSINTKLNKCDYFALFIAFITLTQTLTSWEYLLKYINKNSYINASLTDGNDLRCCCSHKILKPFIISNKEQTHSLIVGSVCVEKNLIQNKDTPLARSFKIAKKQQKDIRNMISNNRKCIDCNEYNIKKTENARIVRCRKCYKKYMKANNRSCIICHRYNIIKDRPIWVNKCKYCYATSFKK